MPLPVVEFFDPGLSSTSTSALNFSAPSSQETEGHTTFWPSLRAKARALYYPSMDPVIKRLDSLSGPGNKAYSTLAPSAIFTTYY